MRLQPSPRGLLSFHEGEPGTLSGMKQRTDLAPVQPGVDVVTRDGVLLGTVGRIDDRGLRVDPNDGEPYWLAREDVALSPTGGGVVATFARPELERRSQGIGARLDVKPDDGTPAYLRPGTSGTGAPD